MSRVLAATGVLICCVTAHAAMPGQVTLSDGRTLTGKILFPTRKLRLLRKGQRAVRIPWDAISAIQVLTWRERAYREVVKTQQKPLTAPVLEFRIRIVLRNGACFWGILSTRFTIETRNGTRRTFGLTRRQRGKVGQTVKDLLHVVELRLARLPGPVPCLIALQTEGIAEIQTVRVFGVDSQHVRRLAPDREGVYRVEGLWPDRYDMLVVTPRAVYLSLSGEIPTMPGDVLTYEKRRSLGRWLSARAGAGVKRRALTLAGRVRRSRVLVLEETRKAGQLVERRLDIYQIEHLRGSWTISFILPVYRDTVGKSAVPLRWLNLRNELAVAVGAKQLKRTVVLKAKLPEKR